MNFIHAMRPFNHALTAMNTTSQIRSCIALQLFPCVNPNESNHISGYAVCPETGLLGGSSVRFNLISLRYIMDLFNFPDLTVRYRIMNVDFYSNFEYHYILL